MNPAAPVIKVTTLLSDCFSTVAGRSWPSDQRVSTHDVSPCNTGKLQADGHLQTILILAILAIAETDFRCYQMIVHHLSLMTCPACGAAVELTRRRIIECQRCGHRWMNNSAAEQRIAEQNLYSTDYAGYRPDPVFERTVRMVLHSQIQPLKTAPAEILDVGCGAGAFLTAALEAGYLAKGIDVSPAGPELCRARGLDAVSGDYLTYDFGQQFDIITMWDVIEHLHDPASFFMRSRELLRPGGILFGKVPSFGDLSVVIATGLPRAAGILLGAPSHIQYFDRESLGDLLSRLDFRVEWLPQLVDEMRSRPAGGSLKRRMARSAARTIKKISGDRNLQFVAYRA